MPLGGEHIALHLAQRDRAFGKAAVGVKDRVGRILPSLIVEAGDAAAVVFDKAVPVGIAAGIDPVQRRHDVRP